MTTFREERDVLAADDEALTTRVTAEHRTPPGEQRRSSIAVIQRTGLNYESHPHLPHRPAARAAGRAAAAEPPLILFGSKSSTPQIAPNVDRPSDVLYEESFAKCRYGCVPEGWKDEIALRPSRGWLVDGKGLLRPVLKLRTGLLVYDGYTADVKPARVLADARLVAEFQKTEDAEVSFGIAGRVVDGRNYYLARFSGTDRLELFKVKDGVETALDFQRPAIEVHRAPRAWSR